MQKITIELLHTTLNSLCDKGTIQPNQFEQELSLDEETADVLYTIFLQDGYTENTLTVEELARPVLISITSKGVAFVHRGGYKEMQRKEQISESVSISVLHTNRLQRWSFWASLFTGLVALAVSVFGLLKDNTTTVNPSIILKDTLIKSTSTDTLQLQIQLRQLYDTLK